MEWNRDIGLLLTWAIYLVLLIMFVNKRNVLQPYFYYLFASIGLIFIIDVVGFIILKTNQIDGAVMLYLYLYGTLFLLFLILLLMYRRILKEPKLKRISSAIVVLFLINYIVSLFFIDLKNGFPIALLITNVFFLLCSIALFLIDTFQTNLVLTIKNYYPFWFSLGLIVVYVTMIPQVIISTVADEKMSANVWSFLTFLINFIGYGIMLVGLFFVKETQDE